VFIEFRTNDEAAFALMAMQGYPFDAKHTFAVNLFCDIERFASIEENYAEPQVEEYVPRVRTNIASFLIQPDTVGRDI
jgi:translation initiation factor 3 subunit B